MFSAQTLAWRSFSTPDVSAAPSYPCFLIESNGKSLSLLKGASASVVRCFIMKEREEFFRGFQLTVNVSDSYTDLLMPPDIQFLVHYE